MSFFGMSRFARLLCAIDYPNENQLVRSIRDLAARSDGESFESTRGRDGVATAAYTEPLLSAGAAAPLVLRVER